MRRAALLLLLLLLLLLVPVLVLAGPVPAAERRDWRELVTVKDRQRLRDWRTAWVAALADARGGGGTATIAADPVLFDPDAALAERALPPPGAYRCRHISLGARPGGPALVIEAWGRCRIEGEAAPLRLTGLDGGQRPAGLIYPDIDRHAIFLGTTMFPDEHRPATYGHAAGRDMAGAVERIGEERWRLILPYPHFGGALDVVELRPAASQSDPV